MKYIVLFILSILTFQKAIADCTNCTYVLPGSGYDQNFAYMNSTTLCINGNMSISNMNFNGSNNVLCIYSGVTFGGSFNPGNVTINVYGTFNFSGNVNSNVTFNVYNGGVLNISNSLGSGTINNNTGGTINMTSGNASSNMTISNSGTLNYAATQLLNSSITNSGNFNLTTNGQISIQNVNITNNGTLTATIPSKVLSNQGTFTNNGTVNIAYVENQEGNITNNSGATFTFQQGTFEHGQLHNYGSIIVNCPGSSTDCSNPCMKMGNKNAGQFSNDGNLAIHGTLCMDAGVTFHNNGTTTIDNNMVLDNNSSWVQGSGANTTVGGTTTSNGSNFTGGNLCSGSVNGSVNSTTTTSCGSPATISDINATTCKNTSLNIAIVATAPSGSTVKWSTLKLINGTDTVLATASVPKLTTTNGTYTIAYTASAASVLFAPTTGYTGSTTIKYIIAAQSGTTVTYATATKNINVTIAVPPTKPKASIAIP